MRTIKTKPIYRFYEFAGPYRVERREDGSEVLIQPGYAFVNETVPGDRYTLKRSAMMAATDGYAEWGALREMHQPLAAGFVPKPVWDERGAYIEAHVVDPIAQHKVRTGTYKGFSVGVTPKTVNRADEVEACEWIEISLVDRPKDPQATFVMRAADLDPEQEVEVEVLDEGVLSAEVLGAERRDTETQHPEPRTQHPASSPSAEALPPAAEAPDPTTILSTPSPSDPDPSVGASPSAARPSAQAPVEGVSSHTEEERAALLAAGLPESMLAGVEVVPPALDRSLGAPVIAIPPATTNDTTVENVGDYRVEQAPTGMWCAYGPAGDLLGEFETELQARAHVAKCKAAMAEPEERAQTSESVPVRENLDPKKLERYIKQEDGKWCVYSEDGKKLGEHDSKADAVDQLQAIEANKAKQRTAVAPERVAAISRELVALVARADALQRELVGGPVAEPAAAVEAPPPAQSVEPEPSTQHPEPSTVSRSQEREETTTPVERLQTVTAELSRVQVALEAESALRATAEAEVQRLRRMPLDREKPVVRYAHALDRTFIANLGNEAEQQITVLRADYEAAKKEAAEERHGDRDKLNRATERMILRASQLAEHGILVS